MGTMEVSYRDYLKNEFERRKRKNLNYSLRAFARDLGIPAPKLSQALRGISGFSAARAEKIASSLQITEDEKELFVALVESEHARSKTSKQIALNRVYEVSHKQNYNEIEIDQFKLVSEWYHFAILELTNTQGFKSDPRWIAETLDITTEQVEGALSRLIDSGLLEMSPKNVLVTTKNNLATTSGIPSSEIRKRHSQILTKAQDALENIDINERDFSTMTIAIDPSDIKAASEWIKAFRRRFTKDLEKSSKRTRVYNLSIEFFPLDKTTADKAKKTKKEMKLK